MDNNEKIFGPYIPSVLTKKVSLDKYQYLVNVNAIKNYL